MICCSPYNTWPLHVKIFRPEALKEWENATKAIPDMPPGFTVSVELEGVDGNGLGDDSGWGGPIDVRDSQYTWCDQKDRQLINLSLPYTMQHLRKWEMLLSKVDSADCAVCSGRIDLKQPVCRTHRRSKDMPYTF